MFRRFARCHGSWPDPNVMYVVINTTGHVYVEYKDGSLKPLLRTPVHEIDQRVANEEWYELFCIDGKWRAKGFV